MTINEFKKIMERNKCSVSLMKNESSITTNADISEFGKYIFVVTNIDFDIDISTVMTHQFRISTTDNSPIPDNIILPINHFADTPIDKRGYDQYEGDNNYLERKARKLLKYSLDFFNKHLTDYNITIENNSSKSDSDIHASHSEMQWTPSENHYLSWLRRVGDADGNKIYGTNNADTVHQLVSQDLKADEDNSKVKF